MVVLLLVVVGAIVVVEVVLDVDVVVENPGLHAATFVTTNPAGALIDPIQEQRETVFPGLTITLEGVVVPQGTYPTYKGLAVGF